MAEKNKRKGHCPKCGPDRSAKVVGKFSTRYNDTESGFWGGTDYRILQCGGCDSIYYQSATVFSEDQVTVWSEEINDYVSTEFERIEHWPPPVMRAVPLWDRMLRAKYRKISDLLCDVYGCLNADLAIPAAISARTVFDSCSEILGVDQAISFKEKLDRLETGGHIGRNERQTLAVLADAGSAAAHRGWKPSQEQLDTVINILESFIQRAFILNDKAAEMRADIPPKQLRKKK